MFYHIVEWSPFCSGLSETNNYSNVSQQLHLPCPPLENSLENGTRDILYVAFQKSVAKFSYFTKTGLKITVA